MGGGRPRWIFHGTPAGGAGVHGCLEAGSSVAALCYDEHHRTHLKQFLSERAVEAMVSGTSLVFKDAALLARSVELNLLVPSMVASAKKKQTPEEKHSSDEQETEAKPKAKNERKQRKPKATSTRKKARTVAASSDSPATDNDGESDDNSDTEPKEATRTPPAKKPTRT